MAAFFSSLEKTIGAGFALLLAIIILISLITGQWFRMDHGWFTFAVRWLHVLSGIMWIGLLYYFNFVQTPTMPKIEPADLRVGVTKFILPQALFWFRWAAMATMLLGLLLALMNGYLIQALTFQKGFLPIGIGMWLGLIMAYNVWMIIWPNQKKVLGLTEATADEKAAAGKMAGMTSRINTMLSIPMLYCMVVQQHGI